MRPLNDAARPRHGEFVLYWCATALRADENPALEVAIAEANARGLPVLVFQELTWRTPYASDRAFRFVLEGVPGLARDLTARGVRHVIHLERGPQDPGATLLDLARRASVVVTEDFPTGDVARARERLAASAGVPVLAVDSACVLPMRLVGKAHERAFAFRDATAAARLERLRAPLPRIDPDRPPFDGDLGFTPTPVDEAGVPDLVASCAIDHGVGAVLDSPGGEATARRRWEGFREHGLRDYAARRDDAACLDGVSRLSPYLHFGMISAAGVARQARQAGGEGARKFLDELLVWRELAYTFCFHRPDHAAVEALPDWARESLGRRQGEPREVPPREAIERGATGDPLWDLCQRSLLRHGELHNNVRMTWGKKLLEWTRSPAEGLALTKRSTTGTPSTAATPPFFPTEGSSGASGSSTGRSRPSVPSSVSCGPVQPGSTPIAWVSTDTRASSTAPAATRSPSWSWARVSRPRRRPRPRRSRPDGHRRRQGTGEAPAGDSPRAGWRTAHRSTTAPPCSTRRRSRSAGASTRGSRTGSSSRSRTEPRPSGCVARPTRSPGTSHAASTSAAARRSARSHGRGGSSS